MTDYPLNEQSIASQIAKRAMDVVLSAAGLTVLSPVMLLIALGVRLDSSGPALFRQARVGHKEKLFWICKFRTMIASPTRGVGVTPNNDRRVTRFGKLLRKSKLDELPQLFNVLIGDMSLVGPRPEIPEYMDFYTPEQRKLILSVKPGITDYAALMFHDEGALLEGFDDPVQAYRDRIIPIKFEYYYRYCREICVSTDCWILLSTVTLVLFRFIPTKLRGNEDVSARLD